VADKTIAVLGLAFKANTDDVRDSPALTIVPVLQRDGAIVRVYDPIAMKNAVPVLGNGSLHYAKNIEDAVTGADAVIILTEWKEFTQINWKTLREKMKRPLIIDLRNIYTLPQAQAMNMDYISLGRSPVVNR
jgi:UDPglucose 6-dehydrogenase